MPDQFGYCTVCLDKLSLRWPCLRKVTAKQMRDRKTCGKNKCKQEHRKRLREAKPVVQPLISKDQFIYGRVEFCFRAVEAE